MPDMRTPLSSEAVDHRNMNEESATIPAIFPLQRMASGAVVFEALLCEVSAVKEELRG
jgi:hypothetical protein